MSEKRGMFEQEALVNLLWFAMFFGLALLVTLIAPRLIGHSDTARRIATATAAARLATAIPTGQQISN